MRTIRGNRLNMALLLCGASLAMPFWAAPAMAQGAAADENGNDIIVTAQRRSEKLEDVPMTVSVVTQETLAAAGINSVRDLANVTTGFQIANAGITTQPSIRGVTTTNAGAYENNVALFVDGLYQTTAQALNMDLPNVESIQILKGPQGTLYGRNATGGAILVETVSPSSEWKGNVEATYGRFDDWRARAFVAGPLSEKVGISLAGTFRQTDGYYKIASRTTPGQFDGRGLGMKQHSLRVKLQFEPTETLKIVLGYNKLQVNDPRGVFFTPIENVANSYAVPGRTTRPRGLGEFAGDIAINEFKSNEGYAKIELETGIGLLRSVTGYTASQNQSTYDSSGNYVPDLYIDGIPRDKMWQQSLDLNINTIDKLNLIIGANYYNFKTDYPEGKANVVYLGPASLSPFTYPDPATTLVPLSQYVKSQTQDFKRTKEAWAVFADATFQATDKLSINIGGRYSKERQDVAAQITTFATSGAAIGTPTVTLNFANSAKQSNYDKFTVRASLRYEIAPRTNIYASFSQGFRGGEWNAVVPSGNPALWVDAKQETVNAYEIGLKKGGGRFRYELSGFYYDYKNLQISAVTFVNGLAVVNLQNAPQANIYGAEASFDFDVADNFTIRGGATLLNARYGDRFVYIGTGVNPAAVGFNTSSDPLKTFINVASAAQDLSGLQMARSPDFAGFIGFDYTVPMGEGGLKFAANLKYSSSFPVTDVAVWGGETLASYNARLATNPAALPNNEALLAGTPYVSRASEQRAKQDAYVMLNASVTWTDPTDHYYVRIWGNNLTDSVVLNHYRPSNGTYIPVGDPLTFGGTIGFKF